MHPLSLPCSRDTQMESRANQQHALDTFMEDSCDPIHEMIVDYGELGAYWIHEEQGVRLIVWREWFSTIEELLKEISDRKHRQESLHVKRLIDQANESLSQMEAYLKDLEARWPQN